jgi:hypothetical protein
VLGKCDVVLLEFRLSSSFFPFTLKGLASAFEVIPASGTVLQDKCHPGLPGFKSQSDAKLVLHIGDGFLLHRALPGLRPSNSSEERVLISASRVSAAIAAAAARIRLEESALEQDNIVNTGKNENESASFRIAAFRYMLTH